MGMGAGGGVLMYASYLPLSGWCTRNEPAEKRHVKGEHMGLGNVLVRELMGVTIPKE